MFSDLSENLNTVPEVIIYTDGACLGNPGPGGWASILTYKDARKEISGGFSLTTNNRMEILAVISGLEALSRPCQVLVVTDSRYVRDAVEKGWLKSWISKSWMRNRKDPVKNRDLWERLVDLLKIHKVKIDWIRGHSGHPENERCDFLASQTASSSELPADPGYDGS